MMKSELLLNWIEVTTPNAVVVEKKSEKVSEIKVNGNVYYLKKKKSVEQIKREVRLYNDLQNQIKIAVPMLTKHNQYSVDMDGVHYCLYEELEGTVRNNHYSLEQAYLFGEAIASLHKGLMHCDEDALNVSNMDLANQLIEWAIPTSVSLNPEVGNIENYLKKVFIPFIDELPHQIIHRDPNPSNMLFSKDNRLSGFIDFDLMCVGLRIFDLCYCCTALLMGNFEEKDNWFELLFETVKGYQKHIQLTREEIQSIFSVLLSIQLIFIAYFKNNHKQLALDNMDGLFWIFRNEDKIREGLTL